VSDVGGSGGCAGILSRFLYYGGAVDGGMGAMGGWLRSRLLKGVEVPR